MELGDGQRIRITLRLKLATVRRVLRSIDNAIFRQIVPHLSLDLSVRNRMLANVENGPPKTLQHHHLGGRPTMARQ